MVAGSYYIHSCRKMRYKGDYRTQYILDYDTGQWDPLDDKMKKLLDERSWVSMSRERKIKAAVEETRLSAAQVNGLTSTSDEVEAAKAAEAYAVTHPQPVAAMESGLSLVELNVPGTVELYDLLRDVHMDKVKCTLGRGTVHKMEDLQPWHDGMFNDPTTIRGLMAELGACLGAKVMGKIVVDFGTR